MDILEQIGEQMALQRARLGISLEDAAHGAGIDPERLANGEEGTIRLTEAELSELAGVYGVDVTAFFGGRTTPLSYLFGA
ncbi:MAG: helix-turn-helix transcriptional regulator [Candidatus Eremiobacteraeota bacterium]|nr:helix-turn-helix transcriptional regulator [Candidatus Eremiobacteraeota bacterium]